MRSGWGVLPAIALAAVACTGCADAAEPEVARVATAFEDGSGDPRERCDLLAPSALAQLEEEVGGSCADVIGELPLDGGQVAAVEVWGRDAQVRMTGDTVFLNRTPVGWRVVAAVCAPREAGPYDCEVEG